MRNRRFAVKKQRIEFESLHTDISGRFRCACPALSRSSRSCPGFRRRRAGFRHSCHAKLRSTSGESIAETLIALLISSVGLVMLASMITASARLITKSKSAMESYYGANNYLESRGEDAAAGSAGTGDNSPLKNGSMTITLKPAAVSFGSSVDSETFTVNYYENATIGGKPVVSYEYVP